MVSNDNNAAAEAISVEVTRDSWGEPPRLLEFELAFEQPPSSESGLFTLKSTANAGESDLINVMLLLWASVIWLLRLRSTGSI